MALPTIVYLAIDAGGTFLKSAVLNAEGKVLQGSDSSIKSVSEGSGEQILHAFSEIVTKGLEFIRERVMKLEGIGIAFPGPFDIYKATPLMKHKFQGIYGLNMRKWFYGISGIPDDIPIKFIHDANAVLSGEIWKGNARGFRNAAVVTLGTGLGFAISEDGKVLCNDIGGPYISIFNLPFKDGNLEDYTAKRGFIKIYRDLSGKAEVDGIEVADIGEWADHGDEISIETFNEVGQILAQSLQEILILRNIECLLFSGQISRSFHHLEPSLKKGLKNIECLNRISVVQSIENAALLGALYNLQSNQ
jgi:glucokinase